MTKVNRIAVMLDEDEARITLYKTNTKLAEFSNYDIDVPPYDVSGAANKSVYQAYCKDVVINLLENGGIEGYYYEEKQKSEDTTVGRKYGTAEYGQAIKSKLIEMLDSFGVTDYKVDVGEPDVTDRYKGDRMVKNGTVDLFIKLGNKRLKVKGEIKSGQICKPKHFDYQDKTFSLNGTNIKRVISNK